MNIAVLGLGLLGTEIALRLHAQGHSVVGVNRAIERPRFDAARQQGLPLTADVASAVAGAEMTLLLLSDAAAIEATLMAKATTAAALTGRVLVQMGTIAPDESRALAMLVTALGGAYLEAPVLGSLPEARAGTLIVMAGGDADLFTRCRPLLADLGRDPQHIGAVGQAAALKLAFNQLIAGLTASFALSLGLVRHEGIAVEHLMTLLRGSALYAPTFDKKLNNYLAHEYRSANFPLKHLHKDVLLFQKVASISGLDTSVVKALAACCARAEALGYAAQDYSALYEALTADMPTLDVTVLAALVGVDDPVMLRDLLTVFERSATTIAAELLAAGAAGDIVQVQHLAHKLKSPARTAGAMALGECCAALELAAQHGERAALAPLLAEFAIEMTAVEQALRQLTTQSDETIKSE